MARFLPTMASADFCSITGNRWQISQGKCNSFHPCSLCIYVVVSRAVCSDVCRQLPSDSTSRWTPLLLANASYCKVHSGLAPYSYYTCLAHIKKQVYENEHLLYDIVRSVYLFPRSNTNHSQSLRIKNIKHSILNNHCLTVNWKLQTINSLFRSQTLHRICYRCFYCLEAYRQQRDQYYQYAC